MNDELVTWYRAQLDEIERVALNAPRAEWSILLARDVEAGEYTEQRVLDHVMLHDPDGVLADVESKRRILDEHTCRCSDPTCGDCNACSGDHHADPTPAPCTTVKLLALACAGRPGYREEWRV